MREKNSGYFYTYHSLNSENKNFSLFYEANPINLILPPNNLIILRIKSENNSPNNDNLKHIFNESNITFNSYIKDLDENNYAVICTLWEGNGNIRIFCRLNENLKSENQRIILKEVNFNYKGYNVIILPETYVTVYQRNYNIPFLYSERQNIELNDEKEFYELKFQILSYNNEIIYLTNYFILDDCKIVNSELICNLPKKELESNLKTLGL